ncbi:MAG: hypothetical protein RLY86_106 [Pseudomonadota bacterium]|jgi:hypothetical protein
MTKSGEDQTTGADPAAPRPFSFRWRRADGRVTVLNCLARSQKEAEESARRAGWPGHDGTRADRFRAWLKQAVLSDLPPAPMPGEMDAVVPPPQHGPALRLPEKADPGHGKPVPPAGEEDR